MITALTAREAAERLRAAGLRISPETVRDGVRKGTFPFGDCVVEDGRPKWCYIYENKLERWIQDKEEMA